MKEMMSKKRVSRMSKANLVGIVFLALAIVALLQTDLAAENFVVTNLNDGGEGSLRWAISSANTNPGPDIIEFTTGGTINVLSPLPALSDTSGGTTIDGTTAPGYSGVPIVVLNDSNPGWPKGPGLWITSSDNIIRGLQIISFGSIDYGGIYIEGYSAANNVIEGCYIGTDGVAALPNNYGIRIREASNTRVGTNGDGVNDETEGNVISGNTSYDIYTIQSSGNIIAGNYIGTDASGTIALSNSSPSNNGISLLGLSTNNRIGTNGDSTADLVERNIISGHAAWGIELHGSACSGNIVSGNYIGTDVTGTVAVPNGGGIKVSYGNSHRIGTNGDGIADQAERNVISGNRSTGIELYGQNNIAAGNYIGTDATGKLALGNDGMGIVVYGTNNRIGTDGNGIADETEGNVISNNGLYGGIWVQGQGTNGNIIAGNYIGTDVTGTVAMGNNNWGIKVEIAENTRIGTNGDGIADEFERNIISGNEGTGIGIYGPNTIVAGNYIGTDVTGTLNLGNGEDGIGVNRTCRIGTDGDGVYDSSERNIISGNQGKGIDVGGSGNSMIVAGNYIGTDVTGILPLGNSGHGVCIAGGSNNVIGGMVNGCANVIAFNGGDGIALKYSSTNRIRLNSIHSNGGLGIDLNDDGVTTNDPGDTDSGANDLQNFSVITSAIFDGTGTTISGTINSTANTSFTIDLYGNTIGDPSGFGEGQTYLGTTMCLTDSGGNGTWTLVAAGNVTGLVLSSTATDPTGNTSEFSAPQPPQTNLPPVANAGPDQTAHISDTVTLDGSQSNDPDGNYPLIYSWTIVQKPSGSLATLTNPDQVNPTITIDKPGTYTIQLIVTDSLGAASDPTQVNISTINSPPVLNPIGNKTVNEGNLLEFTVTATDPDGDTLSYSVDNLPTGSNFDPQTQLFSWTPEFNQSGNYQVVFIVTDSGNPSESDSETITITVIDVNRAPEADARPDQAIVGVDKIVTLDGSFSYDPDEDPLTYQWSFESIPPGSTVVFSDSTVVNPSFTPDMLGDYVIRLTVSDGSLVSEDSITITAVNTPVSENGEPVTVIDEPTGITITYDEITSPGNTTVLTSETNPVGSLDPNFKVRGTFFDISTTATYVGNVTICIDYSQLGVKKPEKLKLLHWELVDVNTYDWVEVVPTTLNEADNTICGTVANLSWFVLVEENHPPVANAGENISINTEDLSTTIIQGTGIDQDGDDTLQYRWKEGETILLDWSLVGENGECPLELITTSIGIGTHTLTLEITDNIDTASDDMILTIENSAPHAGPTGGGVYEINSDVILGGFVSDYDGDFLSYLWKDGENELFSGIIQAIPGGDPVQLPNDIISNLTLGVHIIALFVDDGINNPVSSEITVEVVDTGPPTLAPVSNKTILWPPNHQMEDITIEANAWDNSGIMPTLTASVYSNEPEEGLGDGDMTPDWTEPVIDQENGIISLQLRAERSGSGDGRIYTISITAEDQSGNTSTVNIEIIVPHDKKKN